MITIIVVKFPEMSQLSIFVAKDALFWGELIGDGNFECHMTLLRQIIKEYCHL